MSFNPDWRVSPGETIKDCMDERGLSLQQLAVRMGVSVAVADALVKGYEPLTAYLAGRLELALGVSARLWVALEDRYRSPVEAEPRCRCTKGAWDPFCEVHPAGELA